MRPARQSQVQRLVVSPDLAGAAADVRRARADHYETLIVRLGSVVTTPSARSPDPSDGVVWVELDAALSGLHGALIALRRIEQGHSRRAS